MEFIRRNPEAIIGLTQPQLFAAAFATAGGVLLVWRMRPAARLAAQSTA